MVVANCPAALSEIKEKNCNVVQNMNFDDVFKLMNALNACTEYAFIVLFYKFIDTRLRWGQVFILDAIATYHTDNEEQILQIFIKSLHVYSMQIMQLCYLPFKFY